MREIRMNLPIQPQSDNSRKKTVSHAAQQRKPAQKQNSMQQTKHKNSTGQANPARQAQKTSQQRKAEKQRRNAVRRIDKRKASPAAKRRVTAAETRRKQFRKRLWTAFLIISLAGLGIYLSVSFLFKIEKYEVQGESLYTQEDFISAFGLPKGESIFGFSTSEVQTQMQKQLPYLEEIKIRRRLPDTIVFIAEPAQERYAVKIKNEYAVLSSSYKVLRTIKVRPKDLIYLPDVKAKSAEIGRAFEAENPQQQQLMTQVLPLLQNTEISDITKVDLSDPYNLSFCANGGDITVLLGTTVKLDYKLRTAEKILQDELPRGSRGTLDVTAAPSTGKTIFR